MVSGKRAVQEIQAVLPPEQFVPEDKGWSAKNPTLYGPLRIGSKQLGCIGMTCHHCKTRSIEAAPIGKRSKHRRIADVPVLAPDC